jgi:hypothetical protein
MNILDLLKMIPVQVQVVIVSLLLGGALVYAAESRYVSMDRFTKAYVLDLKKAIREVEYILRDEVLTDRERRDLEMELEELIDELCFEAPEDRKCDE